MPATETQARIAAHATHVFRFLAHVAECTRIGVPSSDSVRMARAHLERLRALAPGACPITGSRRCSRSASRSRSTAPSPSPPFPLRLEPDPSCLETPKMYTNADARFDHSALRGDSCPIHGHGPCECCVSCGRVSGHAEGCDNTGEHPARYCPRCENDDTEICCTWATYDDGSHDDGRCVDCCGCFPGCSASGEDAKNDLTD